MIRLINTPIKRFYATFYSKQNITKRLGSEEQLIGMGDANYYTEICKEKVTHKCAWNGHFYDEHTLHELVPYFIQ